MSEDVSHILNSWEYNPENTVRILKTDDVPHPKGLYSSERNGDH